MTKINTVPWSESIKGAFNFVENPVPVINKAIEKYGDTYYTRIIGGRKIIMSVDPKVAQHVLQKNNKSFEKSELQTESLGRYVGLGLLTANGEYWLRQRRLIQPGFHKARLNDLIQIMYVEIVKYFDEVEARIRKNTDTDITDIMMELTLRVVSKALFSTGISDDMVKELGSSINTLQKHIIKEVRLPIMNWWRRLNGATRRAKVMAAEIRQILQEIIDQRKANGTGQHGDLLDMLLESKYEDTGEGMSNTQILDEAIILFVAGYETTAVTLAWTMHCLREYPKALAHLENEIGDNHPFTMDSLMKPNYIGQVIDETMRKYPAAWILDRVSLEDHVIDNIEVRKGDLIGLYVFGTHRNSKVWNEPELFDPDRFSAVRKKQQPAYAFFPFGGGPRMCIGYHFAYMEMRMAIIEFLRRFKLPPPSGHEPDYLPLITLKPKENIRMKLTLRIK